MFQKTGRRQADLVRLILTSSRHLSLSRFRVSRTILRWSVGLDSHPRAQELCNLIAERGLEVGDLHVDGQLVRLQAR